MRSSSKRARISGCGINEIRLREVGDLSSRSFVHVVAASENLVLRLGIHRKLEKHTGCVNTLSFNAGGDIIVTGSDDRTIVLWDWDAGLIKSEFQSGHSRNVLQARIMPYTDDKTILSCGSDGQVRRAQILEGGQMATALLGRHEGRAHKLAVEPGSPHIFYSCGEDGVLQHFDLRTKSATKLFVCKFFEDKLDYMPIINLYAIAVDPRNPHVFAIGGSDEYVRVYDIRKYAWDGSGIAGYPCDCFCPTHLVGDRRVGITGLDFSERSELLASYNDELIYLFLNDQGWGPNPSDRYLSYMMDGPPDDSKPRPEPQEYRGHRNRHTLKGVSFFGPNAEYVVSGSDCGSMFVWRKKGGELLQVLAGDKCVVNCVEPHPHATMLASSGIDNDIKIWTPNAVERARPVNADEYLRPVQVDYCVIAPYNSEESDDGGIECNDVDNDYDDPDTMTACFPNS